jgi:D-glycero-alpha-D-manno-heptose-7-phosphate kinase
MIITRTPFRISFFGGATDYPAWYKQNGGKVLATTIDKYCYISVRELPPFFEHKYRIVYSKIESTKNIDEIVHPSVRGTLNYQNCTQGLEIHHDGDLPARSGLGSSSSFTVGLLNALDALKEKYTGKKQLAETAIHVEQDIIEEHVGSQDQISAAYGGFNEIEFFRDGSFSVNPIIVSQDRLNSLNNHLMLFFSGITRFASEIAKSQISNFDNRHTELSRIREMVDEGIHILRDIDTPIQEFGKLLHQTWEYKKSLSDKVSNPEIDQIYNTARDNGAIGGKILGAGGGGFILLFVEPEKQEKVKSSLSSLTYVPFKFENSGSKVVLYQPNGFQ